MKQNGSSFTRFAKGAFVGGLAGAVAALLYVNRKAGGTGSVQGMEISDKQSPDLRLSAAGTEVVIETGIPAKSSVGWRVLRSLMVAGLIMANVRVKKTTAKSNG